VRSLLHRVMKLRVMLHRVKKFSTRYVEINA